jgi:hypothetical protein
VGEGEKEQKRPQKGEMQFNPSMFYIKNSTGEILKFKTSNQPAFTELHAEEMQELEFDEKEP